MHRFSVHNIRSIENAPTSPASLSAKIDDVILGSTTCRAKVEAVNLDTGEYRVVLQGTLDLEGTKPTEK